MDVFLLFVSVCVIVKAIVNDPLPMPFDGTCSIHSVVRTNGIEHLHHTLTMHSIAGMRYYSVVSIIV